MIQVTKLHPFFMAEIGGVDLTQPVLAADYAAIDDVASWMDVGEL